MRFASDTWSHEELGAAFTTLFEEFPRASLSAFARAARLGQREVRRGTIAELVEALRVRLRAFERDGAGHAAPPEKARRQRRSLVITERELRRFRERPAPSIDGAVNPGF